jgi:hypothetical protein
MVTIHGAVAGSDTTCPPDTAKAGTALSEATATATVTAAAQVAKVLAGKETS